MLTCLTLYTLVKNVHPMYTQMYTRKQKKANAYYNIEQ